MRISICLLVCACLVSTLDAGNIRYNVTPVEMLGDCRVLGGYIETDGTMGVIDASSHVTIFRFEWSDCEPGSINGGRHYFSGAQQGFGVTISGSLEATATSLTLLLDDDPEVGDGHSQTVEFGEVRHGLINVDISNKIGYKNDLGNESGMLNSSLSFLFEFESGFTGNSSTEKWAGPQSQFVIAAVPEPTAFVMLMVGMIGITIRRRRLRT